MTRWLYAASKALATESDTLSLACETSNYATRSVAADLALRLPFAAISMSRPSLKRSRISRSIEKPDSLPCLRAETLG
jgi:hypothetical protein